MINRFLETGRYIKPELITRYGNDINNTYEQAKKATSIVDGFSKWSNDVPLGSRPKLIEYSGSCEDIVRAFKPTMAERLEQSESNCRTLRAKIDEVNDVFRKNPELSFAELGMLLENKLTKSGVSHRLRRIRETAEKIREQKEEQL